MIKNREILESRQILEKGMSEISGFTDLDCVHDIGQLSKTSLSFEYNHVCPLKQNNQHIQTNISKSKISTISHP